jgi:hypothetical protein
MWLDKKRVQVEAETKLTSPDDKTPEVNVDELLAGKPSGYAEMGNENPFEKLK